MKNTLIICLFCFLGQMAYSQSPTLYTKEYISSQTTEFASYFTLNEQTRLKTTQVLFETNEYIKEVNARIDLEETQKQEKRMVAYWEMDKKLMALLTLEQQQNFDNFKNQSTYFQY